MNCYHPLQNCPAPPASYRALADMYPQRGHTDYQSYLLSCVYFLMITPLVTPLTEVQRLTFSAMLSNWLITGTVLRWVVVATIYSPSSR